MGSPRLPWSCVRSTRGDHAAIRPVACSLTRGAVRRTGRRLLEELCGPDDARRARTYLCLLGPPGRPAEQGVDGPALFDAQNTTFLGSRDRAVASSAWMTA